MKGKVVLLIALAIVLLSVSAANMGTATLSDNGVLVRPDGTKFIYEVVQKSDSVRITKVTMILPNGTSEVFWSKTWVDFGTICYEEIPPPQ